MLGQSGSGVASAGWERCGKISDEKVKTQRFGFPAEIPHAQRLNQSDKKPNFSVKEARVRIKEPDTVGEFKSPTVSCTNTRKH